MKWSYMLYAMTVAVLASTVASFSAYSRWADRHYALEARLVARLEAAEASLAALRDVRTEDVDAVNRATANLWTALTNGVPSAVAKSVLDTVAKRLGESEDKVLLSHERRLRALEDRYGRRPR